MTKSEDLQPWLDYFGMLQKYESTGLLEVQPGKGEAYVTQVALHALSEGDSPGEQLARAIPDTVRRLRAYAGWICGEGGQYLRKPFAVHVVKDREPHDLVSTILLVHRRPWWRPWRKREYIKTVIY